MPERSPSAEFLPCAPIRYDRPGAFPLFNSMEPRLRDDSADMSSADDSLDLIIDAFLDGRLPDLDALAAGDEDVRARLEEAAQLAQRIMPRPPPGLPVVPGYGVLSELGHGGMGVVYLAQQERVHGRLVALKVLPLAGSIASRSRSRFLLEAKALSQVSHPHVVRIYEVVEDVGFCAYAMEWIDGKSMAQVIVQAVGSVADLKACLVGRVTSRPASLDTFWLGVGIAIARALSVVHGQGIVHRDVKPSNILLGRDGHPYLADFGLVRVEDASIATGDGRFVGTLAYAAPEQIAGAEVDARSDVYSLGATLCYALANDLPTVDTPKRPPLPRDRSLRTVLAKATAAPAGERYGSADELAEDLERVQRQERSRASRDSWARRWCRETKARTRRRLAVGTAVVALLVLVSSLVIWGLRPSGTPELKFRARPDWLPVGSYDSDGLTPAFEEKLLPGVGVAVDLFLADVDGDGDLDLLSHTNDAPIEIWLGDGAGGFVDSGERIEEPRFSCGVLGDVDGDGLPELLIGHDTEPTVVWRNAGAGVFYRWQELTANFKTQGLALGDLDGDGDLDLVQANVGSNQLFRNDGGKLDGAGVRGHGSPCVALGDFDRDGSLDIFLPGPDRPALWLNRGHWQFEMTGKTWAAARRVAVGDLDGRNGPDVALVTVAGHANPLLLNDGQGGLDGVAWKSDTGPESTVRVADFDGDGIDDLLEFRETYSGRVLRGRERYVEDRAWFIDVMSPRAVVLGDVDSDGRVDVVTSVSDGGARAWLNRIDVGGATGRQILVACVADFTGDGLVDLFYSEFADGVGLMPGRAGGGFGQTQWTMPVPSGSQGLALASGDFDGDGRLDVAVGMRRASGEGVPDLVLLNTGDGEFKSTGQSMGDTVTFDAEAADIDGDGALDIVWGCLNEPDRVWINDGSAHFTETLLGDGTTGTFDVTVVDVDGDGRLDIISGTTYYEQSLLWRNAGDSEFALAASFRKWDTWGLAVLPGADAGTLELLEISERIYQGQVSPLGRDGEPVEVDLIAARHVVLADVVGDERPEVVLFRPRMAVFDRSFQRLRSVFDDLQDVYDVSFADLDGDGDLDAVTCHGPYGMQAWENTTGE